MIYCPLPCTFTTYPVPPLPLYHLFYVALHGKQQVGTRGLSSLIAVLQHDAPFDPEIAKAVLETLMGLMEVGEKVRN